MKRVGIQPALHRFADGADLVQRWCVHVWPTRIQSLKARVAAAARSLQVTAQQRRRDSSQTHLGVHLGEVVPSLGQVDDLKGVKQKAMTVSGHWLNPACSQASSSWMTDVKLWRE